MTTRINHFSFHIGDFLSGTTHMEGTEIGAYTMLLIAHYQAGEEGLPDDDKRLARIAHISLKQWLRVKPAVMQKFIVENGTWKHSRVVSEIRRIDSMSSSQRDKALKRWKTDDAAGEQQLSQPITNSQERKKKKEPPPSPKGEDFVLPDDIPRQPWDEYEEMRKKIRKPMTLAARKTAIRTLNDLRRQGHDPTAVLQQSIFNSWQGLFPIKDTKNEITGRHSKQGYNPNAVLELAFADQTYAHLRNRSEDHHADAPALPKPPD